MDKKKNYYFSTRDLMMMAALAAVGGISSTYINMIGDFFQSFLGFAGGTQWAAGLHIVWLMLAALMIRKPGAATTVGLIKGIVEFLTGNTHGLIVLIVNIIAGLIIDMVLIWNKGKKANLLYYIAAGISSASNIVVFQFIADIPSDVLTLIAILSTSAVSFVSGVVFGGFVVKGLLDAIERAGIYHPEKLVDGNRKISVFYLISSISIVVLFAAIFFISHGNIKYGNVGISGEVNTPYEFSANDTEIDLHNVTGSYKGVEKDYIGYPLIDIIRVADPRIQSGLILIKAGDGYSYFVSYLEALENDQIIIDVQNEENDVSYNLVGPESPKAWVRGVSELILIKNEGIQVKGAVNMPFIFLPEEWQKLMDGVKIHFGEDQIKLQGVQLREIVDRSEPKNEAVGIVLVSSDENQTVSFEELNGTLKESRIFVSQSDAGIEYIFANMSGEILLRNIQALEVIK